MRLLHFDCAGNLVSTDFSGRIIPAYAILSHRWGDAEVLFEDLSNNTYKEKAGYQKIEFCAEQAAQDQLQYFWIDTCCIDKWKLEELSKAINSMFRWYQDATKCYVFLPDVSVTTATEIAQRSAWEASFRASAWFTRGWTLQELIAPVSVEFFSSEGRRIGDKQSLEQLVHEITNIPVEALRNCPLDEFTISKRIKWAEKRETTEPEDKVYCLLGILDIFMPTSYGEGKEKAWSRLQIELDAASGAPSIIPFSQNDHFVGRELQLDKLEAGLFGGKQTATMAIVGPGGTGKSQLALELTYRTRQKNKSCSVFWIDASNVDSIYQSYASMARKINISGWDDEKADVKQLVKLHLSRGDASQCLLIFDNADSINLGSVGLSKARAANLIDYLPQSERCSILFTTTSSDTAKRLALENVIELGEMAPHMAQMLLQNYLNPQVSTTEQLEAGLLLQELSHLPLALVQVAAYINTSGSTLQDYRSQLAKQKERDLERSSELLKGKQQESGTEGPVARTLLLSMDKIRRDNPLAAEYLFLAACVDQKDIPLELLTASSHRKREDAIRILNSYALITRRPAESAIDIHRLVHRALRDWLQEQKSLGQWAQKAIKGLLGVFPNNSHGSRSKWRRLLPHAKYALSHIFADQGDVDMADLAWKCVMALYSDGRYGESEELLVQVMETRKRVLGDEHPDTLTTMDKLASTILNQGRWKEAEELFLQVMETRKRMLEEEHEATLSIMNNVATTYWHQGRLKEAEQLHLHVKNVRLRVLGKENRSTLSSMGNLASTYRKQGRWNEAEELEVQVTDMRRSLFGANDPETLSGMSNQVMTYNEQGKYDKAAELCIQVVETRERELGEGHPDTISSVNNLATILYHQGRMEEAKERFTQIVETRRERLGEEHPDTLISKSNLGFILSKLGKWKEAEELEVLVMETRKRVLGQEHLDTLLSIGNLAWTYRAQKRLEEAEALEVQVMETRKTKLGADHPSTLTSMANLASTYRNQGRWKEAEELEVQVMETRKRVLGAEHPDTLASMNSLAFTLKGQS
ncbi:kinesin light chain [Zopfia rhizophila CBS 207.26]|uniref:Kinesin light chain n=1 Tax=Zopfia rhizophila CBS 207.26 TaxID=1314779 RepID=A0A6A6E426_9PEZI|nr:kinesin light chain [Zopfia rhizophila CBS 207.26]